MKTNRAYPCSLCGQPMRAAVLPCTSGRVLVTCCQGHCPAWGRALSEAQHLEMCEALRREIVLTWSFDRCLSRPVPVALVTALTLLVEVAAVTRFHRLREGYCKFVLVCSNPDLLFAAECLMQRCVPVNGDDTADFEDNGGWMAHHE